MTSMEKGDTSIRSLNDINLQELANRQHQQNIYAQPSPSLENNNNETNNNNNNKDNENSTSKNNSSTSLGLSKKPSRHVNKDTTTKGKYTLNDFQILRTLGTGSFGRVHLTRSIHNGRFYAMKVLKKQRVVQMKQIEHTNDERRMLKLAQHPSI